jgi:gamma-glutamyl hercynylcysteine S-oxide synthase
MTSTTILGQLGGLHEMQLHLLESVNAEDAARQFHPQLPSLNWLFGHGIYVELYWLRERLTDDGDLAQRVSQLFTPGALPLSDQCAQLPPRDHLINWGSEIRDEHLRRMATPGALRDHPLTLNDRLQWFLLQEQAKIFESMLEVLNQRSLNQPGVNHQCTAPLKPAAPHWKTREISQGHYRIGARDEPKAYDNELPPQAVELSSFRIALNPVSNAQYLAFIQAGGYEKIDLWSPEGQQWLETSGQRHPAYWRQNSAGDWYEVAINGNSDLPEAEPVAGISRFEAEAFTNWVSQLDGEYTGAVLQHEYQWEIAARSGVLPQPGRVWEWCSNPFHPYPEYQPFPGESFPYPQSHQYYSLRGASLHTQRVLRRPSMRHWAKASENFHFTGARLVFPPRHLWN